MLYCLAFSKKKEEVKILVKQIHNKLIMHSTETLYVENLKGSRCNSRIRQVLLKVVGVHEVTAYEEQSKVYNLG